MIYGPRRLAAVLLTVTLIGCGNGKNTADDPGAVAPPKSPPSNGEASVPAPEPTSHQADVPSTFKPKTDDAHDFDWAAIEAMVVSGRTSSERYSVEEVTLQRVPMPGAKVFFVVDKQHEALLGPKQALFQFYPEARVFDHHPQNLRSTLETREYVAATPDELFALAAEVVPLLYGCRLTQHEIVTETDLVASGRLPVTKDILRMDGKDAGLFVSYYARIGPWKDIVNATAVLQGRRLQIYFHPLWLTPRVEE